MKISTTLTKQAISTVVLIIIWKFAAMWIGKSIIIPSPEETLLELIRIVSEPDFFAAVFNTLHRVIIGFSITFIVALVLGGLSGFSSTVYHLMKHLVLLSKSVPTMAVILLALIWLRSEKAPILVAFLVTFPILYQNVVQGIRQVDLKLIEMVNLYGVNKWKILKDLYLPSIRSYLLAGMSTAMGLTIKIVIAAEVLSQPYLSIGTSFQLEKAHLNTAGVFAWSFIAIVLASIFDWIIEGIRYWNKGEIKSAQ